MEFFRFIKWQWNRFQRDEKILLCMVITLAIYIPLGIFVLPVNGWFIVGSTILFCLSTLIFALIYEKIHIQWMKYREQMDAEQQAIVDKLAGKPTRRLY